ncbi:MAG: glycosyltransferase family 39 protein [Caldilineaceae bacterium]|nr:glycosyltransferase family 39 protein [Caldilineaceae bacterium]
MKQISRNWRLAWLLLALTAYLLLAGHQLGLPGLHYDEAKEAGVNAMELLTGAPVTAFRGATVNLFGADLPLMVQDYIGSLNVYLALPFLAATGIGVPNLRLLPLLLGLLALLTLERTVSEWLALRAHRPGRVPISLAGLIAITLLATSPSFVFWNRQGIFVTNATLPCTFAALWLGLRWLRTDSRRALLAAAFAAGLALYAKLLAAWVLAPFGLLVLLWWIGRLWQKGATISPTAIRLPHVTLPLLLGAALAGTIPLLPFLLFNSQTRGTLDAIGSNLGQSYYGVQNSAVLSNLPVRLGQIATVLRGDHFWYLGGLHANSLAPWLAGGALLAGLLHPAPRRRVGLPLLLCGLAVAASLFTVSDLFITHYALLQPLFAGTIAIAIAWLYEYLRQRPGPLLLLPIALLILWLGGDITATLAYHQDLTRSGGLAAHSDATYHLAYHLRYNGLGAPIALDWGLDAPVRYLSQGTVTPIELFGYASLTAPDDEFSRRLSPFLDNPDNVYLLHAPGEEVFAGRRDAFFTLAQLHQRQAVLEATFAQRDGKALVELWRLH